MRRAVPPSAEIEHQIDELLAVGVGENPRESLSELAKLGARLIIQRAVEDEFEAWLGRTRYERRPDYQRACATHVAALARRPLRYRGGRLLETPQFTHERKPAADRRAMGGRPRCAGRSAMPKGGQGSSAMVTRGGVMVWAATLSPRIPRAKSPKTDAGTGRGLARGLAARASLAEHECW